MSTPTTLQTLAFYAREHFGEDGYPFEESIPTSLDVVFGAFLDGVEQGGTEGVRENAETAVVERLRTRPGFAPVLPPEVAPFVRDALSYLQEQFATEDEARRN